MQRGANYSSEYVRGNVVAEQNCPVMDTCGAGCIHYGFLESYYVFVMNFQQRQAEKLTLQLAKDSTEAMQPNTSCQKNGISVDMSIYKRLAKYAIPYYKRGQRSLSSGHSTYWLPKAHFLRWPNRHPSPTETFLMTMITTIKEAPTVFQQVLS